MGDLVRVRKELRRPCKDTRLVLGTGHGKHQSAGIEQGGQLPFAKERLELRAARMEAVGMAVVIERRDRKQRRLRQREERRPDSGVVVVFRSDRGDDQVIGIVASGQKEAHERFVIADVGLRDRGVHKTQILNRRSECGGADGSARGLAYEFAPALEH